MSNGEKTVHDTKRVKIKPLPTTASDLLLIMFSLSLCGLWLLIPMATDFSFRDNPHDEHGHGAFVQQTPVARYVNVEFPNEGKDYITGKGQPDDILVNDAFALQTTLPPPSSPPQSFHDLADEMAPSPTDPGNHGDDLLASAAISDLPPLPEHPYSEAFSEIKLPEPAVSVTRPLLNAGFTFSQPTNPIPENFSFSAKLSFDEKGNVLVMLVDTGLPDDEFRPWQNALMLSTTTNAATGTVSFQ